MNIILLGAPGAGKGTQATKISEKYRLPHISTGDIFRDNIKRQTPVGLLAKSYTDNGKLVPDEVTCEIVKGRLEADDCKNGYLLDGFPRNLFQAETLESFSKADAVLNIDVDLSLLMARLCGRRVCKDCGESYHVDFLGGKTVCERCGGELYQRKDDNEETVGNRLKVYSEQTAPLIAYYSERNVLLNIDGVGAIDEVFARIVAALK
ncbi:adenylate kinase [Candidatus Borkfalkia ceftriaxoniphila]|mgnify:FL=1|jgi:adenylate kinase|uniref:Adenylate kinase n=1 Tax=Candidatus Borkfalkia ceftriaxoniphila TaxID=2508949 RepID=A0A4Q2KDB4_9FIRM|nr:adenylate kinase [Candidatus Borkfalkia ceftriaxoniphila]RXZ61271.1 adenylate kinase [Candidatus Borkfalkia ceftriaxoniphila]